MISDKLYKDALERELHKGVAPELILKVMLVCAEKTGRVGYAHMPDFADHLSDEYKAIIACVYCGFLVWDDHLPGLAMMPAKGATAQTISVFKITDFGIRYLETVHRTQDKCKTEMKLHKSSSTGSRNSSTLADSITRLQRGVRT